MNQNEIQQQAEAAAQKAEHGDKSGLTAQLNNMTMADRVAVAREMVEINARHRDDDDSLPKVQISVTTDTGGAEHLQNVEERDRRGWYNPEKWFGSNYDGGTSVYSPPGSDAGNGMAQQAVDATQDYYRRVQKQVDEMK